MGINYPHPVPTKKPPTLNTGLLITVGSQVGAAILGIIFIALVVGLGLDELLETEKHPFTIILFLGSAPFSLIVTYWLAKRASRNINPKGSAYQQTRQVEKDDERE